MNLDLAMMKRKGFAERAVGGVPSPALVKFSDESETMEKWLRNVVECIDCLNLIAKLCFFVLTPPREG